MTILVIGFTGPPTIHFKFIVKCDNCYYKVRQLILLQSTTVCYYKVRQLSLQCATGITKCKNFGRCGEVQLAVSATSSKISQFRYYIIKKFLKCVSQRNGVTGCYPLQFRPCFGFHLLQLVLSFELIFVRRVPRWSFLEPNRHVETWISSETPTNKDLKFGTIARLSSRVENPTSRMIYGYPLS